MAIMESNKNYEYLFEKPEDLPRQINKNIGRLMELYPDIDVLKGILKEKYGEEFFEYTYLNDLISYLYSEEVKDIQYEIIGAIKTLSIVKEIYSKPEDSYRIVTEEQDINISPIKYQLNKLIKSNNISEKLKENVLLQDYLTIVERQDKRIRKCHELSIDLAKMLTKYFKQSCNVVTGNPRYYVNQQKYLHSWVEIEVDGKTYIIDSTMNTVLEKEAYYMLRHVNENEILSSITGENIIKDEWLYGELLNDFDHKTYLTSRDEIIKDLEKNKHLFDKSDEGEER